MYLDESEILDCSLGSRWKRLHTFISFLLFIGRADIMKMKPNGYSSCPYCNQPGTSDTEVNERGTKVHYYYFPPSEISIERTHHSFLFNAENAKKFSKLATEGKFQKLQ